MNYDTIKSWGLGSLIAIVVLIVCIVLMFIDKPLSPFAILGMLAALALSRLV